ncbi:hypothetical protein P9B03_09095 [Metasolibacillus meyeri]|uniref:Uncharacterized protein n=1 Tax=Metasolibacillus meyeri TaxID=1071052 RepID=A0AAW9NLY4_9BACL|nr:hypothetical protein [Metasolibacillus meyeri]MEC1178637.1 hypothetical protein [Metasolibacillus meyeri]
MKKMFLCSLSSVFLFSLFYLFAPAISTFAASENVSDRIEHPNLENMDTDEVNSLLNALLPGEKIVYETTIVQHYNLLDDGSLVEVNPNIVTPFATIPSSDLTVWSEIYDSYIDRKGKRVWINAQWNKTLGSISNPGTKGDKISIAVPLGWDITAGSYSCQEHTTGINPGSSSSYWVYQSNCGGGTYDLGFSGAVWSLTQTQKVWHKASASLRMERTSSTAQNKIIGQYVRDTGNSTTWTIGYGPASISIIGNKSTDKVSWDTPFTY